jgi:hypothetical protein
MENKKQSSIEFFLDKLYELNSEILNREISSGEYMQRRSQLHEQATEMHKQEIMDGYLDGFEDGEDSTHDKPKYKSAEQYYNLTFKNQENDKV